MRNIMNEHFIKKLMSTTKCSVCGEHYEINNIKVLRHEDDMWFLNVFCPSCRSQALVAAVVKKDKSLETTTDLTKAESAKFTQAFTISADDILDLHNFLQDFDGDFAKLFSQK